MRNKKEKDFDYKKYSLLAIIKKHGDCGYGNYADCTNCAFLGYTWWASHNYCEFSLDADYRIRDEKYIKSVYEKRHARALALFLEKYGTEADLVELLL